MTVHTFFARSAAVAVAAVAGAASWSHIASVAIDAGERPWVGYSLPVAIDGLIIVGVAALLDDRRNGRRPRMSARIAVLVGVLATLAANVASAQPGLRPALVAVAAPVAFMLSIEVLTRTGRPARSAPATPDAKADLAGDANESPARPTDRPRSVRSRAGKRSAAERVQAARRKHPAETQEEIGQRLKLGTRTVARYWRASDAGHGTGELADHAPDNGQHDGMPNLAPIGARSDE